MIGNVGEMVVPEQKRPNCVHYISCQYTSHCTVFLYFALTYIPVSSLKFISLHFASSRVPHYKSTSTTYGSRNPVRTASLAWPATRVWDEYAHLTRFSLFSSPDWSASAWHDLIGWKEEIQGSGKVTKLTPVLRLCASRSWAIPRLRVVVEMNMPT